MYLEWREFGGRRDGRRVCWANAGAIREDILINELMSMLTVFKLQAQLEAPVIGVGLRLCGRAGHPMTIVCLAVALQDAIHRSISTTSETVDETPRR